MSSENWKERSKAAYARYLDAVASDLSCNAGVAEIETVMLKHYQAMMTETMQALVDNQGLSPRARKSSP
jgi:hypothetical protein